MSILAPRGTYDVMPDESANWIFVEEKAREISWIYGYSEVRTPILKLRSFFSRGIGEETDIVEKEMYTFPDKKGRSLTLRPEGTASVVRAYLERKVPQDRLFKAYYIGPFFRYERPQAGRYRQFYQWGIEAIGSMDPALDVETIKVAMAFYSSLGLKNLSCDINSIGCRNCRTPYKEALKEYFKDKVEHMCPDCRRRLDKNPLRILDCKRESCIEPVKGSPVMIDFLCDDCRVHFENLKNYLSLLNIPFKLNPFIVRGLDYYTKTVYEVVSNSLGAQNSLCGGGRYDNLIEDLGGPSVPAVGFAAGLERAIMVMEKEGGAFTEKSKTEVFFISMGVEAKKAASKLLDGVRSAGIMAETDYLGRSIKTQMKEAGRLGAKFVALIGDEELKSNSITVKDMVKKEQESVRTEELVKYLKEKNQNK
ncbi:MAG: histidine--tRNA ligase [Firmicutes bacterium]|nr:histidine--tRNA ligase [Bacillota bacterium]